jgi:integrase
MVAAKKLNFTSLQEVTSTDVDRDIVISKNEDGSPRSKIFDLEWDFKGMIDSGLNTVKMVSFYQFCPSMVRSVQRTTAKIMKLRKSIGVGGIKTHIINLSRITSIIESNDWSLLNNDENFAAFCKLLKEKKLSAGSVRLLKTTLDSLFVLGLTTRRIKDVNKFIKDNSCKNKQDTKQTIALPEAMMISLYNHALNYVDKYFEDRHKLSRENKKYIEIRDKYKLSGKKMNNFSRWLASNNDDIDMDYIWDENHRAKYGEVAKNYNPKNLIQTIQQACMIVIDGFSGVRLGEALSFTAKNYFTIEYNDITVSLLSGFNTKNQKKGKKKLEVYPTHPIVEKALKLAYDMSQFARVIYKEKASSIPDKATRDVALNEIKSTFIILSIEKQADGYLVKNFDASLSRFAHDHDVIASEEDVVEFNILNPVHIGKLKVGYPIKNIGPHIFRRTFAVFLKRNKLGDILTLRYVTKHKNLGMTAWYANHADFAALHDFELDSELDAMIIEANQEMFAHELFYIFNEAETLSGEEGERIMASRNAYEGTYYMSFDEILNQVKTGQSSLVELVTGFCISGGCERLCGPGDCNNKIVTPEKALVQAKVRERLIVKFEKYNTGMSYSYAILQKLAIQIESIEQTLLKHNISFDIFKNKIN